MKKQISSLVLALSLVSLSSVVRANWLTETDNSGWLSYWKDEDEEDKINKKTTSSQKNMGRRIQKSENSRTVQYNSYYDAQSNTVPSSSSKDVVAQSPLYFVPSDNGEANIDYDTLQSERSSSYDEVANSIDKWKNSGTNVFWENYRGNNIRIEMLRNNRDLKEMRLKFVQSQSMTSDPDGSISDILNVVADRVMKRTCGKKSKQSVILYERPSVELERETAADNYKIMAKGTSLKEYGFRCIY